MWVSLPLTAQIHDKNAKSENEIRNAKRDKMGKWGDIQVYGKPQSQTTKTRTQTKKVIEPVQGSYTGCAYVGDSINLPAMQEID